MSESIRTLLIDNYDSYTFNLFQLLSVVNGGPVDVIRNDDLTWSQLEAKLKDYDNVVISPGPGTPERASDIGISLELLRRCPGLPILGVCLGHQAMALVAGAKVVHAPEPVHGRLSELEHMGHPLFRGIPSGQGAGYRVVRYHSLVVDPSTLPSDLEPIAWACGGHQVMRTNAADAAAGPTPSSNAAPHQLQHPHPGPGAATEARLVMAIAHRSRPHFGVQFHPESIGTEFGYELLRNFRDLTLQHQGRLGPAAASGPVARPSLPSKADLEAAWLSQLAARSVASEAQAEEGLGLVYERLEAVLPSLGGSERVFRSLYCGASPPSSSSPAAAPEPGTTYWLDSTDSERGRFSFMGGPGGPLWRRITYRLRPGCVNGPADATVRHSDASTESVTCPHGCFAHLQELLRRYQLSPAAEADCAASLPFDFWGGLVGYLGYELKAECGGSAAHVARDPDAAFFLSDRFLAVDHCSGDVYAVAVYDPAGSRGAAADDARHWCSGMRARLEGLAAAAGSPAAAGVESDLGEWELNREGLASSLRRFGLARGKGRYLEDIDAVARALHDGESYEVCLTNCIERQGSAPRIDPWEYYLMLRSVNPAPYAAWMDFGGPGEGQGPVLCCSSPERFLRACRGGWLEARPIKGTAPRCPADPLADSAAASALAASEKDRAENLMIVDLLRNDLGRVCQPGSVHVPGLMEIESYATVHQMVSTVCGARRPDIEPVECVRAAFPGGSMTGAPKVRTMEIIDRLEGRARGIYSGSIGYFSLGGGAFDLNIVIRTAVFHLGAESDTASPSASVGAGGAIVVQSDREGEFEEMLLKARALLRSFALCEARCPRERARAMATNASLWPPGEMHVLAGALEDRAAAVDDAAAPSASEAGDQSLPSLIVGAAAGPVAGQVLVPAFVGPKGAIAAAAARGPTVTAR